MIRINLKKEEILIYENKGNVYFCNPEAYFKDIEVEEKNRKSGRGSINSIHVVSEKFIAYVDDYLLYKIKNTTGFKKLLLRLRLSTELIEVTMAYILRNVDIKQILPLFMDNKYNFRAFLLSVLLSPLALPIYISRLIWVHTR